MASNNFFTLALTTALIGVALLHSAEAKSILEQLEERIIVDLEALLRGVHIDYSYNQSQPDSSDEFSSVPGCPKSDVGHPWVHFGSTPRCYLAGTQGPCSEGEKLFVKSDSHFGYCSCACIDRIHLNNPREDHFCKPHPEGTREFVHLGHMEKCYTIYEQGPCGEDEWIVKATATDTIVNSGKQAHCRMRTCPTGQIPLTNYDGTQICQNHIEPIYGNVGPKVPNKENCKAEGLIYSEFRKDCVAQPKKVSAI